MYIKMLELQWWLTTPFLNTVRITLTVKSAVVKLVINLPAQLPWFCLKIGKQNYSNNHYYEYREVQLPVSNVSSDNILKVKLWKIHTHFFLTSLDSRLRVDSISHYILHCQQGIANKSVLENTILCSNSSESLSLWVIQCNFFQVVKCKFSPCLNFIDRVSLFFLLSFNYIRGFLFMGWDCVLETEPRLLH